MKFRKYSVLTGAVMALCFSLSVFGSEETTVSGNPATSFDIFSSMISKPEREGFDAGVNQLVLDGLTISIPSYFGLGADTGLPNTSTYYAESSPGRAAVWLSTVPADPSRDLYAGTVLDATAQQILENYPGAELMLDEPIVLAQYNGRMLTFLYRTTDNAYLYRYAFAIDPENQRFLRMYLCENEDTSFSYLQDFNRVLGSISQVQ